MEKSDNHKILKARKQMNEQELIYQIQERWLLSQQWKKIKKQQFNL